MRDNHFELFLYSCNKQIFENVLFFIALDQQFITILDLEERVAWLWAALIVFGVPEIGVFLRSLRVCFFKTASKPTRGEFFMVRIYISNHTSWLHSRCFLLLRSLRLHFAVIIIENLILSTIDINRISNLNYCIGSDRRSVVDH